MFWTTLFVLSTTQDFSRSRIKFMSVMPRLTKLLILYQPTIRLSTTGRISGTTHPFRELCQQSKQKKRLIRSTNEDHLTFNSTDETSRRGHNQWTKNGRFKVITHLNRNRLKPKILMIYEGAHMRITRNIQEL